MDINNYKNNWFEDFRISKKTLRKDNDEINF